LLQWVTGIGIVGAQGLARGEPLVDAGVAAAL
jgi:hypothetical protein